MCIHIAYCILTYIFQIFDYDDDADFQVNINNCIANVDLLRSFGASLPGKSKQTKRKRGPPVRSVKIKLYNLPEGSKVPRFNNCPKKGRDPLLVEHMNEGYGKKFTCNGKVNILSIWNVFHLVWEIVYILLLHEKEESFCN